MWRMDEAARGYAAVNNSEDKEMMQKRWEIGLTYELVRRPLIRAHYKLNSHQETFLRVLAEMTFVGIMTTAISEAVARRFLWLDIASYPPKIIWRLMPTLDQHDAPDLVTIFGHVPQLKEGEAPWWRYPKGIDEAKPAWWDDPAPEVCSLPTQNILIH